ncbi:MAG: hypothetical protein FJ245_12325 [Nitrospira sp.]|nr:hypothetical protein [Nitrospira sp.]
MPAPSDSGRSTSEPPSAPPEACGTIIVGHGYPFDKANILRHPLFLHARFHLLLLDFRYFGDSNGTYTTAGLLETEDIAAAVSYLEQRNDVDPERIGALGFSMSAATFLLARHPGSKPSWPIAPTRRWRIRSAASSSFCLDPSNGRLSRSPRSTPNCCWA